MDQVLINLAEQIPVAVLLFVAVKILYNEFRGTVEKLNAQNQEFLKKRDEQGNKILNDLVTEVKSLAMSLTNLQKDFTAHDAREWAALGEMSYKIHEDDEPDQSTINPKTRPRK